MSFKCVSTRFASDRNHITLKLLKLHVLCNLVCIQFVSTWNHATLILYITKTRLYNVDPLKPHFYIVKLGFTEVYIIFHISAQNIDCGYSLKLPHLLSRNMKNIRIFIGKFSFFGDKIFSILE